MQRKVNILGTMWVVHTKVSAESDKELRDRFGYCSHMGHRIVIADLLTVEDWKEEPEDIREAQERQTMRHEVIHAFLDESGLRGSSNAVNAWAINEEMVDWIASQYPKIKKVFELLKCED
jgi:hypothetical protein